MVHSVALQHCVYLCYLHLDQGFNETKEFLFKWIRTHNIGAGPPRTVEESCATESNTSTPLRAIAPAQRSTADGQPCRDTQADLQATNLSSCNPPQSLTITAAHYRAGDTVRKAPITYSTDTAEDPTPPLVTKGLNEESSADDENDFEVLRLSISPARVYTSACKHKIVDTLSYSHL